MVAAKKTTPTVKAPPKPKFGEVGFKFPVMAEIVRYIPDNDNNYPITIKINLGSYIDTDWVDQGYEISYDTHKDFNDFYVSCDPKFLKVRKQEELKQAKALVAKLTKEISELN